MPAREDYRRMSGRTKSTRRLDGRGTRTKIDLFPKYIRHLSNGKKRVWEVVGKALGSKAVREAFRQQLAPGLQERFGRDYLRMGIFTNTGYAYAVGEHTYHSVDAVGPEVQTPDPILLTYFVDRSLLQMLATECDVLGSSSKTKPEAYTTCNNLRRCGAA
jgi:hypothetical protein